METDDARVDTLTITRARLTREELNAELAKFCRARLSEDDNSGKACEMAFHGNFRPRHTFARWVCTTCGGMSFRAVQLGAPPFCQCCGAKTGGVIEHARQTGLR